jgi:hypothetical protein
MKVVTAPIDDADFDEVEALRRESPGPIPPRQDIVRDLIRRGLRAVKAERKARGA